MTTPLPANVPETPSSDILLGDSPAVQRLRFQIARIAPHFRIALITGEPGSGKQTVARHLHRLSPAASRTFARVPLGEFLLREPDARTIGTLYLRDIDTLNPARQLQFLRTLRALQGRTRVIIATHADFKGLTATGRLLPELYKAIANLELRIPSVRDRLGDVVPIAQAMFARLSSRTSLTPEALNRLRSHPWAGNLRELDTLCRRLAPLARPLTADDIPLTDLAILRPAPERLDEVMRRHVLTVLESCSGNKLRAAELLGISRSTLYRMLDSQCT